MKKSQLVAIIKECVSEVRAEQKAKLVEGRKNGGKKPVAKTVVEQKKAPAKKVAPKKVK